MGRRRRGKRGAVNRLAAIVAARLHPARPRTRNCTGENLLERLLLLIAHDKAQTTPRPLTTSGYVHDAASTKAQRFLLRCMDTP